MALVVPGYQLPNDTTTALTRANLNLMAEPTVTLENGEVVDANVASGISGSKISNLPLSSLDPTVQSKFGFKNYCPNPAFDYWPYGTSFTLAGNTIYNFAASNWNLYTPSGATGTLSQQPVVPGANDTLLLDSKYFVRLQTTGTASGGGGFYVNIPNTRFFSGQTIAVSCICENISGTLPTVAFAVTQNFGTGGSPSSQVTNAPTSSSVTVGSTWTKIYAVIPVASVNGKTVGTNGDDYIQVQLNFANFSTQFYFDFTNFQIELGDASTSFENSINKPYQIIEQVNSQVSGRLTLSSGVPVMTSTVTGATSLYFTPYNGNVLSLWDGFRWKPTPFEEVSASLSGLAASSVFDVFAKGSGGSLAISTLAWTNTTTRATAIVYTDGVLTKSGDKTSRWVGTFATNATGGQTDFILGSSGTTGIVGKVLLENANNLVPFDSIIQNSTTSWTYASQAWRAANADSTNNWIVLNAGVGQSAEFKNHVPSSIGQIGIGTATNALASGCIPAYNIVGSTITVLSTLDSSATGLFTFYPIEWCITSTATFNNANSSVIASLRIRKMY